MDTQETLLFEESYVSVMLRAFIFLFVLFAVSVIENEYVCEADFP